MNEISPLCVQCSVVSRHCIVINVCLPKGSKWIGKTEAPPTRYQSHLQHWSTISISQKIYASLWGLLSQPITPFNPSPVHTQDKTKASGKSKGTDTGSNCLELWGPHKQAKSEKRQHSVASLEPTKGKGVSWGRSPRERRTLCRSEGIWITSCT